MSYKVFFPRLAIVELITDQLIKSRFVSSQQSRSVDAINHRRNITLATARALSRHTASLAYVCDGNSTRESSPLRLTVSASLSNSLTRLMLITVLV